jgi:hypothetical protein
MRLRIASNAVLVKPRVGIFVVGIVTVRIRCRLIGRGLVGGFGYGYYWHRGTILLRDFVCKHLIKVIRHSK